MADSKITALTSISTSTDPANDPLVIVDVSDTSMAATGTTKKVTLNQLLGASGTATLASATISGDLTVRTNKLAVTSTGVGIGTASPSVAADVVGSSAGATLEVLRLQNSGSGINTKTRLNFYAASTNYGAITGGFGASSPEFVFDINTSSGAFIWNNFGSEAMRLNSTGLGVGESPVSGQKLTVNGNGSVRNGNRLYLWDTGNSTAHGIYNSGDNLTFFKNNGTASMTLDASGNLLVGTTNTSATAGVGFKSQFSSTVPQFAIVVNEAGTSTNFSIYNVNAAAYRFYVNNGGTVFATNTTISAISDARLKENVQDIDVGLGAILALKPRKFDWKEGKGKNIKGDRGFIAQEFEQVFPQLVDEWKDAAPEGEAPYKSVRQDLIPVLVKAIQELTARVQTLEAK